MVAPFVLLVAAIDFGNSYSGWDFSFTHEFVSEPTSMFTKKWTDGHLSYKVPTCILIEPDGRTLHSFGYEAEIDYTDLVANQEQEKWFFFQQFKSKLDDKQSLWRDLVLEDPAGRYLPAKTVFLLSIEYMKEDLIKMLRGTSHLTDIREDEIHWVLAVPSFWNDAAMQFMREEARQAGILEDKLTIALEPEAVSFYYHHLPVKNISSYNTSLSMFEAGEKHMVLDLGGDTVVITVHEDSVGGEIKELYKRSGDSWGDIRAGKAFTDFLIYIAGSAVMSRFKEQHVNDFIDLLRDFEVMQRDICPSSVSHVTIKLPTAFAEICKEERYQTLGKAIDETVYSKQVKHVGDKLRIDVRVAKSFFRPAIEYIVSHVKASLQEPVNNGISAILIIGGLSQSCMLQEAIRSNFPTLGIIVPEEAGLAVFKGAIILGHNLSRQNRTSRNNFSKEKLSFWRKLG